MKVYECEQGSAAWHSARAGCLTASMASIARARINGLDERQQRYVDCILKEGMSDARALVEAGYKAKPTSTTVAKALQGYPVGEPSSDACDYAFRLAIERIAGAPLQDDKFETYAMRRGHELEPAARAAHEALGVVVRRAGFITSDDGRIGSSVDGLINDDGASEYKCLVSAEELRKILLNDDLSKFTDQMQTGLLVTEREFMHFGLYCPALEPIGMHFTLRLVERDDDYIRDMHADFVTFLSMVDDYEGQLRESARKGVAHIERALAAA